MSDESRTIDQDLTTILEDDRSQDLSMSAAGAYQNHLQNPARHGSLGFGVRSIRAIGKRPDSYVGSGLPLTNGVTNLPRYYPKYNNGSANGIPMSPPSIGTIEEYNNNETHSNHTAPYGPLYSQSKATGGSPMDPNLLVSTNPSGTSPNGTVYQQRLPSSKREKLSIPSRSSHNPGADRESYIPLDVLDEESVAESVYAKADIPPRRGGAMYTIPKQNEKRVKRNPYKRIALVVTIVLLVLLGVALAVGLGVAFGTSNPGQQNQKVPNSNGSAGNNQQNYSVVLIGQLIFVDYNYSADYSTQDSVLSRNTSTTICNALRAIVTSSVTTVTSLAGCSINSYTNTSTQPTTVAPPAVSSPTSLPSPPSVTGSGGGVNSSGVTSTPITTVTTGTSITLNSTSQLNVTLVTSPVNTMTSLSGGTSTGTLTTAATVGTWNGSISTPSGPTSTGGSTTTTLSGGTSTGTGTSTSGSTYTGTTTTASVGTYTGTLTTTSVGGVYSGSTVTSSVGTSWSNQGSNTSTSPLTTPLTMTTTSISSNSLQATFELDFTISNSSSPSVSDLVRMINNSLYADISKPNSSQLYASFPNTVILLRYILSPTSYVLTPMTTISQGGLVNPSISAVTSAAGGNNNTVLNSTIFNNTTNLAYVNTTTTPGSYVNSSLFSGVTTIPANVSYDVTINSNSTLVSNNGSSDVSTPGSTVSMTTGSTRQYTGSTLTTSNLTSISVVTQSSTVFTSSTTAAVSTAGPVSISSTTTVNTTLTTTSAGTATSTTTLIPSITTTTTTTGTSSTTSSTSPTSLTSSKTTMTSSGR